MSTSRLDTAREFGRLLANRQLGTHKMRRYDISMAVWSLADALTVKVSDKTRTQVATKLAKTAIGTYDMMAQQHGMPTFGEME